MGFWCLSGESSRLTGLQVSQYNYDSEIKEEKNGLDLWLGYGHPSAFSVEVCYRMIDYLKGLKSDFFITKPTRCTNFTNLFWHETLHVSDSSSVHHQEFIHCTLSSGICHTRLQTAFEQDQVLLESCLQTSMTYNIAECTVNKLLMMYRRTVRNMYSL